MAFQNKNLSVSRMQMDLHCGITAAHLKHWQQLPPMDTLTMSKH